MRVTECSGALTIVKVGNCLQDTAVGIERLWPTNTTGVIPVRIQDDFGVDKVPRGYPSVQSFAKRSSCRHFLRRFFRGTLAMGRIYTKLGTRPRQTHRS